MKKLFLFASIAMTGLAVKAQNIDLGLKGGLNLSSIDNNTSSSFNNRLGYHAGVFLNVPIVYPIAIQPEVLYSSQGAKYTVDGEEHSLALNYINIPLMVQAKIGRGFYAEAGPQIGILTGVNDKVSDIETGFFSSDDFKKSDVALGFGLGYVGTSGFGIDARYNLGLTNVNDAGSNILKNNALQIGLLLKLNSSGRR